MINMAVLFETQSSGAIPHASLSIEYLLDISVSILRSPTSCHEPMPDRDVFSLLDFTAMDILKPLGA